MSDFQKILSADLPRYLQDLQSLVNIDCETRSKPGVDRAAAYLRERFREFGAQVQEFPQEKYGDMFYARWQGKGKSRIVLLGHSDTVYPDGTVAQFPFRRDGSRAYGPGVIDMKSGLLLGLYALRALLQTGFENFGEIGLFCNSEEEIGSPVSHDLYPTFVRGANAALVLDPARGDVSEIDRGDCGRKLEIDATHALISPLRTLSALRKNF
ncbi:MAG: M20/M25/M40 family metallo-hydrolase [Chloroflexi bacterium]|nr:M20/M25/M40 family metallo-hydrolase [Chloroflexota bacterium]